MNDRDVTVEDLQEFITHCRKVTPKFSMVDGKENSYWMNLIYGIIWVFNRYFMKHYITTLTHTNTVYFPEGKMARDPLGTIEVGCHEFVHCYDAMRLTVPLYSVLYLSFVALLPVALVAYGFLVCWAAFLPLAALLIHVTVTGMSFKWRLWTGFPLLLLSLLAALALSFYLVDLKTLWLLGAGVFALPLPAPGRYWAELRGYGMSIHCAVWLGGSTRIEGRVNQFTGPAYYFMWPFAKGVRKRLQRYEERARAGDVTDPAFLHMKKFIDGLKEKYGGTNDTQLESD